MMEDVNMFRNVIRNRIEGISIYSVFLVLLFYASPFIDSFTGFLIYSDVIPVGGGNISPSVVLRLILFLMGFIFITKPQFRIIFSVALLIVIFEFIGFFAVHHQLAGFFVGINYSFKTVYAIMLCMVIYTFMKSKQMSFEDLLLIFRSCVLLYACAIIVPSIFGLGVSTYGKNSATWGKIGFLASGNGAGALMGIGSLISLYIYNRRKKIADLIVYIITLITCYLIATKGTLLFSAVNLLIIFYLMKWRYKLVSVFFVFIFISIVSDEVINLLLQSIDVIKFRYERSPNFILFLTSGRISYLGYALDQYNLDGFAFFRLFFGFGAFQSFRATDFDFDLGKQQYYLEAELFDVFFIYGIFGMVCYLLFFILTFVAGYKNKRFFFLIPWALCTIYSMFAGHMIFNGMSILAIVVLFNLMVYRDTESTQNTELNAT
jgi:hypothetical protein